MEKKARGHRGHERNPTLRTGEYLERPGLNTALMALTGATVLIAKILLNRKRNTAINPPYDPRHHHETNPFRHRKRDR